MCRVEEGQRLGTEGDCDENLARVGLEVSAVLQKRMVPQSGRVHLFPPANEAASEC